MKDQFVLITSNGGYLATCKANSHGNNLDILVVSNLNEATLFNTRMILNKQKSFCAPAMKKIQEAIQVEAVSTRIVTLVKE